MFFLSIPIPIPTPDTEKKIKKWWSQQRVNRMFTKNSHTEFCIFPFCFLFPLGRTRNGCNLGIQCVTRPSLVWWKLREQGKKRFIYQLSFSFVNSTRPGTVWLRTRKSKLQPLGVHGGAAPTGLSWNFVAKNGVKIKDQKGLFFDGLACVYTACFPY